MNNNKTILSYLPNRKALAAGVLTLAGIVGFGFAVGLATGVIDVPLASACCIIVPPPPPPPPPPPVPPPTPVIPPVPTCVLTASPTALPAGGGTTILLWTSTAGTSATIDGEGSVDSGDVDSGKTAPISVTATRKFVMTVDGPGGESTCTATVTVAPPPAPTCTLSASPTSITAGDSSTLSWTTTHTTSVSIDKGVGSVNANGSTSVSPASTTTYTETATGAGGTVHCTATVTVTTPPPAAPTCTLSASPTSIIKGDSSTLKWTTTNSASFTIDHSVGSVTPVASGSTPVSPTTTTTYTGTATGSGGTVHCTATITVTATPLPPMCTLTANPTAIQKGDDSTLSWTTTHSTSFTIDHSVGSVTPVAAGSTQVSPTTTTTYTGTATGPDGTAHCSVTITVTTTPPAPTCTLTANPTSVQTGDTSTLTWTTTNADSFSIDHSIGSVTPVAGGSKKTAAITADTTFTGTATGAGGTVHCTAAVTVTTTPPKPTCTLTASPTKVSSGGTSVLTWTTTNATSFSIDNTIGSVTPVAGGSTTTPAISADTTFTGTAVGPGGTVTCTAPVTIQGGGGGNPGPTCSLSASPTTVNAVGDKGTLTWTTTNATSFSIDNTIGSVTPVAGGSTTTPPVNSATTYTGTAVGPGGTITCTATIGIPSGGGGGGCTGTCCTGTCGGGGGNFPNIVLSSLPHAVNQPLAYLYLSQIPYTGLDLGSWGTALYWIALVGWSLAAAYLVLFGLLPLLVRKGREFGTQVGDALNSMPAPAFAGASVAPAPRMAAPVFERVAAVGEAPASRYSAYDGFKSFASAEALSIEDIVKGLARSAPSKQANVEPVYENVESIATNVEPIYDTVEPVYQNVEPIEAVVSMPRRAAQPAVTQAVPVAAEVPSFIAALIKGDRDAVFSTLRGLVQSGADSETFISQIALALDDAYRARTEGSAVHADIKRLTDGLATPVLERLVSSLSTAVDSTYSAGITGAKLALTRALAVLGA